MGGRTYNCRFEIVTVKLVLKDNIAVSKVAKELSIHYNRLYC